MLNTPFAPWPSFTEEEADAVARVLRSNRVNYWTGEEGREFEREFAQKTGTTHAIAVANGTLALELALKGLDIGADDEVIVTPRSFIASASCVATVGARPIFADVDADTQNINAETIEAVLTPKTRAIICVHLAGLPCDMDPIMTLAHKHGISVIEDCAQAHGAEYRGRMVGSIGHIGAWSFCQDKIMTTGGEGGMVTTNDKDLWSRMWSYKDHGKSWEAVYEQQHAGGFPWRHESIGSNFRMLEMQSVIGRIQLEKLDDWVKYRRENAARLDDTLAKYNCIRRIRPSGDVVHAYYRYDAFVCPNQLKSGWTRDRIIAAFAELGIPGLSGSCPEIYLEKAFRDAGFAPVSRLPVARALGETSVQFLTHPTITDAQLGSMCDAVGRVLDQAQVV